MAEDRPPINYAGIDQQTVRQIREQCRRDAREEANALNRIQQRTWKERIFEGGLCFGAGLLIGACGVHMYLTRDRGKGSK